VGYRSFEIGQILASKPPIENSLYARIFAFSSPPRTLSPFFQEKRSLGPILMNWGAFSFLSNIQFGKKGRFFGFWGGGWGWVLVAGGVSARFCSPLFFYKTMVDIVLQIPIVRARSRGGNWPGESGGFDVWERF